MDTHDDETGQANNQDSKDATSIGLDHDIYGDVSNYQIEKKIGRGQFSVVYKARCLVNNRLVAFKKVQVRPAQLCLGCAFCNHSQHFPYFGCQWHRLFLFIGGPIPLTAHAIKQQNHLPPSFVTISFILGFLQFKYTFMMNHAVLAWVVFIYFSYNMYTDIRNA